MDIERKINGNDIELWEYEWVYHNGTATHKEMIRCIGIEQPLAPVKHQVAQAICWSHGRTLGNIAVFNKDVIGSFPDKGGNNAILACEFVNAGKFRHGKERWWCRTHQTHWGTQADLAAVKINGEMVCAQKTTPMSYVLSPFEININNYEEVGIWCSLPAAISSEGEIPLRATRIHVHLREKANDEKIIDRDFNAISLNFSEDNNLFGNEEISTLNITPPSAFEFLKCHVEGREMDCVNCSHCGYPHLDLGNFAEKHHKKHFCGNCGRDSTWSKKPIISTPLKPLHDRFTKPSGFIEPDREINLDDYKGYKFVIWASTPAIIWTADRPQEVGIHVHLGEGGKDKRIIDNTFRKVILHGEELNREDLIRKMFGRTII